MMIGMDGKGAGLFTQFQTIMEAADLYRREPTDTMVMHSAQESEKQVSHSLLVLPVNHHFYLLGQFKH